MSWPTVELSRILKVQPGFAFKANLFHETEGMPLIRIRDLGKNATQLRYTGQYRSEFVVHEGDYLIGMDGDFICHEWRGEDALLNQRVCRLTDFDKSLAVPRFVYYRIQSALDEIHASTPYVTVKHISGGQISSIKIGLPTLPEQSRIVELLDEANRLRRLRREADAKAARILPALFLKMFGDPATNPMGFRKKPLGDLIRVKSGNFLPAKDMAPNGVFPVYGGNGISGYHGSYMFEDRKVVLGRVGAYCGAVHYSEPKAWITDNAIYVSEKLEPLDDHYLIAALEQADLNQYAGRAGQPLISGSRIYPVEFLVPPEHLQTAFSRSVTTLIQLDETRTSATERLNNLWDVLMSRAFSGQLTAQWREAHMKELLAEMTQQARALNLPVEAA